MADLSSSCSIKLGFTEVGVARFDSLTEVWSSQQFRESRSIPLRPAGYFQKPFISILSPTFLQAVHTFRGTKQPQGLYATFFKEQSWFLSSDLQQGAQMRRTL